MDILKAEKGGNRIILEYNIACKCMHGPHAGLRLMAGSEPPVSATSGS